MDDCWLTTSEFLLPRSRRSLLVEHIKQPQAVQQTVLQQSSNKNDLWAYLWGASFVLADLLFQACDNLINSSPGRLERTGDDMGNSLRGLRCLEIGAGTGIGSVAAALCGCHVTMTDFSPESLALGLRNAKRNQVQFERQLVLNWHDPKWSAAEDPCFPLLLASDVLYLRSAIQPVVRLLKTMLAEEGVAIIVDPGRCNMEDFLDACHHAEFPVVHVVEFHRFPTAVCTLKKCTVVLLAKRQHPESKLLGALQEQLRLWKAMPEVEPRTTADFGYCLHNA